MAYNEARKRATMNYYQNAGLKSISIRVPEDMRDRYTDAAKARGIPLRRMILESMDEYIQNHPAGES